MKWIAIALALAALSPLAAPATDLGNATVEGPKVLLIGGTGFSGSVRATGYSYAGFGDGTTVSVHTTASGVHVREVNVAGAKGAGTFNFQLDYDASTTAGFAIEITVGGGTANTKDGIEKYLVNVRRL